MGRHTGEPGHGLTAAPSTAGTETTRQGGSPSAPAQGTSARPEVEQPITARDRTVESCGTASGDVDKGATRADGCDTVAEHDESLSRSGCRGEGAGTLIGPYTLLQKIGEGGMGVVYLAEQVKPVRRQVALKIIRPGFESSQFLGRFEAERQALSLMDHPHIARVLDVGATDSGRPYFVMELVHGVPMTQYCDANRLTPQDRLKLFISVCEAIQHAHQKGIIHRDIKPSNVLVAIHEGQPVTKIIDFGVAKAIDSGAGGLTERTMFTQVGQIVGTVEYMSPEQAELGGVDIDTRTDIYSLGVLLYELLTGSTPLVRSTLRDRPLTEILGRIREQEPVRPSRRLSGPDDTLTLVAAQRQTEPARLAKLVRGELDWIVMKAIEKDRTRRYASASGLARDVQRYLDGDAVEAGPPSATYKLSKLARKHRAALFVAAAVGAVLAAATATSVYQATRAIGAERRASNERDRAVAAERHARDNLVKAQAEEQKARQSESEARAVLQFFKEKVLIAARPKSFEGGLGKDATLHAAIDAAEPGIANAFKGQPAVEAAIRDTLGEGYVYLGEQDLAIRQLARVLALRQQVLGLNHPETLAVVSNLAAAYEDAGRYEAALPLRKDVLERTKSKLGPENVETLRAVITLAKAYRDSGQLKEALALLEPTQSLMQRLLGPDHPDTLSATSDLGLDYRDAGRGSEAVSLLEDVLRRRRATLGADHSDTLLSMRDLANVYRDSGRLEDAIPIYEDVLARSEKTRGRDNLNTINSMNNLASAYQNAGRLREALDLFEQTRKRYMATIGPEHLSTAIVVNNLANAYRDAGRLSDALPMLEDTLKTMKAKLGLDHPHTLMSMTNLARAYLEVKPDKAEPLLREFVAIREKKNPDDWRTFETRSMLGDSLIRQQKYAEAEPILLAGYEGMKSREGKIPAPYKKRVADAGARIVALYDACGKKDLADQWRRRLEAPAEKAGTKAK
jgi:eukaryotic-like serine/threonine-protein kinase